MGGLNLPGTPRATSACRGIPLLYFYIKIDIQTAPTCFYFRTVQRTHTEKDPLIHAATSPHTDVLYLAILKTVTLASTSNSLPDDGVTAPKHVGAVLMSILM